MPTAPPRACMTAGCANLTTRGTYCTTCRSVVEQARQRATDATRENATTRGYNARWRRYREVFLARHPLCCDPMQQHVGQVVPATVVDHIVPHRGDSRVFWDKTNHQAVCAACHNRKTATQDSPFATPRTALAPPSGVHGVR